ncbi:MAG: hypothetical protein RL759_1268 [Verrucomicrobiota bacterium]|jgi:hypothetical protein
MKIRKHNSLLLALLLAPLAALAQTPSTASETVRDRLWIFTVVEGGNNKKSPASPNGNVKHYIDDFAPGGSRMTPAEGAFWLGVPNLLFIRSNSQPASPEVEVGRKKTSYQQYATSFQPLDRVVWSVVGGGGEGGMRELPATLSLAQEFPNIRGIFLDDFVRPIPRKKATDAHTGRPAMPLADLRRLREQTKTNGRPLDVWVTLYTHEINPERKNKAIPYRSCEPPLADFLGDFDVLTLWTWDSAEIPELEANLLALEKIAPKKARIALGLYLWDFQNKKPVSVEMMKHQCDLGLKWLKEGRISEMIFLANTMLDVGMPSADFSRQWIKEHGGQKLGR